MLYIFFVSGLIEVVTQGGQEDCGNGVGEKMKRTKM